MGDRERHCVPEPHSTTGIAGWAPSQRSRESLPFLIAITLIAHVGPEYLALGAPISLLDSSKPQLSESS